MHCFPKGTALLQKSPLVAAGDTAELAEGCEQCALMPGTHPSQIQPRQECDSLVFPGQEQQGKYSAFNAKCPVMTFEAQIKT